MKLKGIPKVLVDKFCKKRVFCTQIMRLVEKGNDFRVSKGLKTT